MQFDIITNGYCLLFIIIFVKTKQRDFLNNECSLNYKSMLIFKKRINSNQWYDIILIEWSVILFVLLPSISSSELMQGTMTGKLFFFMCMLLIGYLFISLKFIFRLPPSVSFNHVDGLLFTWVTYIFINGWYHHIPVTNRLLEFRGLILLYILLRQIKPSKYSIVLMAMILGGTIQAIYGNLQLWGYMTSYHALFKMTGSFFNPGPFAGYLATIFPVIVGGILFKKKYLPFLGETGNQSIMWFGAACVLLALAASDSRAAYLSVLASCVLLLIKRYSLDQWFKKYTLIKRSILLISIVFLVGICFIGIIKIKANSSNGRLLIWQVASGIVADHPLIGVGYDRFKAYYMDKQADYFEKDPDSPQIMVAGDTVYCFNEFLQHTIENGIIGLILVVCALIYLFSLSNRFYEENLWIAKAGIVSIVVFAMFSYPTQILPIKICLILYIAYIATMAAKKKTISLQRKNCIKVAFGALIVSIVFADTKVLPSYYTAWKSWSVGDRLAKMKDYTSSIEEDRKAWPFLKHNGDFLTHYGKILAWTGKHKEAVNVLNRAISYSPNTITYTSIGNVYESLGKIDEAEQAYLKAWYMNPSRFYPKYLLAKLYDKNGQIEKAIAIAEELLKKEVKVESTAVEEIQTEMKRILNRNRQPGVICP